jgi:hypothetical protein
MRPVDRAIFNTNVARKLASAPKTISSPIEKMVFSRYLPFLTDFLRLLVLGLVSNHGDKQEVL